MEEYLAAHAAHERERDQLDRQHVLLVNGNPAILDFVIRRIWSSLIAGERRYRARPCRSINSAFTSLCRA